MLKTLGVESQRELALLLAIVALVAITPLGKESTSAVILVSYRILLFCVTIGSVSILRDKAEPDVCPLFMMLCATVPLLMLASLVWNPGSQFDGVYRWFNITLFGAAFIAMAAMHRQRSLQWKATVLWTVMAGSLIYLAAALIAGKRPLLATFVNPNYFASFLLVGFCAAVALAIFQEKPELRILAATVAILLYYGMTQAWSRGATVAAMGVTVLAIVRFSQGRGLSRRRIAMFVGLAFFIGALASPPLVRKFLDRGQLDPYNYQRPQLWLSAARVIAERPILGVGPGEFYHISKRFSPPVDGTVARYLKRPGIAHSEYLQFAAESGIPAALLLFSLAGYLVHQAIRRAAQFGSEQRVFHEAAILTAAGLGAHALVDNNWDVPVMASGLVVFSLADTLPLRDWRWTWTWSPRIQVFCSVVLAVMLLYGVVIPGAAVYFNETGQSAYSRGEVDRSESMYRLAAAIAPRHHVFLDNAGTLYLDKFDRTGEPRWLVLAESLFTRAGAVNLNAEEPRRHLENVLIQRLTGDPVKDHATHLRIAGVDRSVLTIDPFNPFVRKNLAEALYNAGFKEEAERELIRAIALEPNYVPAYLQIAQWRREAGDIAASETYHQKGLAVVVRYQDVRPTEVYESLLLGRPQ